MSAPFLLDNPEATKLFPPDTIARARKLLSKEFFPGGIGAYSDSRGAEGVRREVAAYIEKRDGFPSDPDVRIPFPNLLLPSLCLLLPNSTTGDAFSSNFITTVFTFPPVPLSSFLLKKIC